AVALGVGVIAGGKFDGGPVILEVPRAICSTIFKSLFEREVRAALRSVLNDDLYARGAAIIVDVTDGVLETVPTKAGGGVRVVHDCVAGDAQRHTLVRHVVDQRKGGGIEVGALRGQQAVDIEAVGSRI